MHGCYHSGKIEIIINPGGEILVFEDEVFDGDMITMMVQLGFDL